MRAVASKTVVDTCWAPLRIGVTFIGYELLSGRGVESGVQKCRTQVWPSWLAGNLLWPPVNWLVHRHAPLDKKTQIIMVVAGGWQCFLSFMANAAPAPSADRSSADSTVGADAKTET